MTTHTKLAFVLTTVALLLLAGWWILESGADGSTSVLEQADELALARLLNPELAGVASDQQRDFVPAPTAQAPTPGVATSEQPAAAPAPLVSTVRATLVDGGAAPIPGAELRSIYADGRARGSDCFDVADSEGAVEIEIPDEFMRKWKSDVFSMTFQASAPLRGTVFVVSTPALHDVTELGAIELPRGGSVRGRIVDEDGAAVGDAVVLLAHAVLTRDVNELRVSGPDPEVRRPRVLSGADGSFRFEGAAAGPMRLLVGATGKLWAISQPHDVPVDTTVDVGLLVLEPVPPELLIAGVVLQPGGQPAGGARVAYEEKGQRTEGFVDADTDGRFSYCPRGAGTVEFVARDPERAFGMSAPVVAERGAAKVRLTLSPGRTLRLRVTDTDGTPLQGAAAMPILMDGNLFADGGRAIPGEDWTRTDASGALELFLPPKEFRFGVSLDGYKYQSFGPYLPEEAPAELLVELKRQPRIEGRVLVYGQPVEGARILIGQRIEGFVPIESGFPIRFFANQDHGIASDSEGRFACPVAPDWTEIVVLAFTSEWATGEVELTVEPENGASGIVVEVTRGGAIAGVVTPPAGRTAEGLLVVASRGDGKPVNTRVTVDGTYRLDGLTPGPWRVVTMLREPSNEVISVAQNPEESDFRWNAEVRDGKTTELDLDARFLAPTELHGRLLVDGVPAEGFTATLAVDQYVQFKDDRPGARLDESGAFVLEAPHGNCQLRITGALPGGGKLEVVRKITFAGVRVDWAGDVILGPVDATVDVRRKAVRVVHGNLEDGDGEAVSVTPDGEGRLQCLAPVGEARIEARDQADFGEYWRVVERLQVDPK